MPTIEWIGKNKVINHHQEVPYHVLERQYSFDVDGYHEEDIGSENMIIHGDNLVALKSLLPRFEGKIKCIYIDPPYNRGKKNEKTWIYSDNVDDPQMEKWVGEVVGSEGEDMARHDKWLCMMYPRLKLLWQLMAKDGFISISIDNTELFNLKCICDEIFGSNNFITEISCINNPKGRSDDKYVATAHEHILIYKKEEIKFGEFEPEEKVIKRYREIDENGERFRSIDLRKTGDADLRSDREDMFYPFFYNEETKSLLIGDNEDPTPEGYIRIVPMKSSTVEGRWRWGKNDKSMQEGFQNLIARFMPNKKMWSIFEKDYLKNKKGVKPTTVWSYKDVNSERGTEQFVALGFNKEDFPKPKPIGTIQRILTMLNDPNAIVLDSFAGSGTTAHAALAMHSQQKFILIEMMDYANDITAERVKRVISGAGDKNKLPDVSGGSFSYYELGETIIENGKLNEHIGVDKIREYIWYTETRKPYPSISNGNPYYLGDYNQIAYYFYYEPDKTSTLDYEFMATISQKADGYVIYADRCALSREELLKFNLSFKKIPRDISRV